MFTSVAERVGKHEISATRVNAVAEFGGRNRPQCQSFFAQFNPQGDCSCVINCARLASPLNAGNAVAKGAEISFEADEHLDSTPPS